MRKSIALVLLLAVLAATAWWWLYRHRDEGNDPLAYVPADTPYVFASTKALSAEQARAMLRQYGLSGDVLALILTPAKAALLAGNRADDTLARLLAALEAEFGGKSLEQIEALLGVRLGGRNVFYGLGLTPVVRIELDQPQAFAQTVARIEQQAGKPLPRAQIDGTQYWYLTLGDSSLRLVMAVIDSSLVVSIAPDPSPDAAMRTLLGLDRPQQSLRDAAALDAVITDYDLHSGIAGYIDSAALLHAITGALSAPDRALLAAIGTSLPQPSAQCGTEFAQLAEAMPRLIVGYSQISEHQITGRSVLQLRSDIANTLLPLRAPMPGLDAVDEDTVFDFGLSINLQQLPAVVSSLVKGTEQAPWQCPHLSSLNAIARLIKTQSTNPALLGSAAMAHSVFVALNQAQWPDGAVIPEFSGALVVGSDNPASVFGIARSMLPALGTVKLKNDGRPTLLPAMPELRLHAPMYVAMSDDALAVSTGADEEKAMPQLLRSNASAQPLLVIGMTSTLYVQIAQWNLRRLAADASAQARAQAEQQLAIAKVYPSMFKRSRVRLDVSERGIELSQQSLLP